MRGDNDMVVCRAKKPSDANLQQLFGLVGITMIFGTFG